jgi:hypothetical protein
MERLLVGRILCFIAVASLGVTTLAGAQVAESFHDLQTSLHGGERLRVTDDAGIATTGWLLALSDHSLRLLARAGSPLDVPASTVHKIERVTSHARKGALVGLISGAAAGMLGVAMTPGCEGFCVGPSKGDVLLPAAGLFGGIGAAVGALIGAARPRHRLMYLAQPEAAAVVPDTRHNHLANGGTSPVLHNQALGAPEGSSAHGSGPSPFQP